MGELINNRKSSETKQTTMRTIISVSVLAIGLQAQQIGVTEGNPVDFKNEDGEYKVEFGLGAGAPMPGPGNDQQPGVTEGNPVHFETPEGEYTVLHGFGAVAPNDDLPDKLCTNGGVGCEGAPLPPKEDDDLPDKLC